MLISSSVIHSINHSFILFYCKRNVLVLFWDYQIRLSLYLLRHTLIVVNFGLQCKIYDDCERKRVLETMKKANWLFIYMCMVYLEACFTFISVAAVFSSSLPVNVCCKFSFEWFLSERPLIWLDCFPCMWYSYEFQYKETISSAPDVFKCAFNRHNQSMFLLSLSRSCSVVFFVNWSAG